MATRAGFSLNRWIVDLVNAHLDATPQLGQQELETLARSNLQLLAIGRNLNQLARAANQGIPIQGHSRGDMIDGARLNPRKHDLQRWREQFAERLREHRVACEATRRLHRLQPVRGEKQSIRHKKARGESFARIGKGPANQERIARARTAELQLLAGYRELAQGLARSPDSDDRKLAIGLVHRVAERNLPPREVTRALAEIRPAEERGKR